MDSIIKCRPPSLLILSFFSSFMVCSPALPTGRFLLLQRICLFLFLDCCLFSLNAMQKLIMLKAWEIWQLRSPKIVTFPIHFWTPNQKQSLQFRGRQLTPVLYIAQCVLMNVLPGFLRHFFGGGSLEWEGMLVLMTRFASSVALTSCKPSC